MTTPLEVSLATILGDPARVSTVPQVVHRLSRDFYWYSPVLRKRLDGKVADVVVHPLNVREIQDVLRYCYANDIPVTPRGAGTGNYGQAVPLHGGVLLDLSRMDQIESITPDGVAICQPGVRLGVLEAEARKVGWELRCYPSTVVKASVGGFLAGGSGGIGSVAHGGLRDFATVRALDVVTMEEEPRLVHHEGEEIHEILHAWGTNGIITRAWLALAPSVEWGQCAVAFDTFDQALDFSERVATSSDWTKRLVTTFEWPIPSFFTPVSTLGPQGQGADIFPDRGSSACRPRSSGPRGRRSHDSLRALQRSPYGAPALRLHLEPHHPLGHEGRPCLHLSAMRLRRRGRPQPVRPPQAALRRRISIASRIYEERPGCCLSRLHSRSPLYHRGALERND